MKQLILLVLVVLFTGIYSQSFAQKNDSKVVCFKSNMDCTNCEKTVYEYLKFEKGVKNLAVDHASNTIMVEYKDGKNSDEKLAKAIEKKGYKAEKISKDEYEKIVAHTQEGGHDHSMEEHK